MTFLKTKTGIALVVLIALFAFLYFFTGAFGGTFIGLTLRSNPDLENGLVAHYTFDGKDVDVSSTTAEVLNVMSETETGDYSGRLAGAEVWATSTDLSVNGDEAYGIVLDSEGYVYVAGYCDGCGTNGLSAHHTQKINPTNGDLMWSTTTDPTPNDDVAYDIAIDSSDDIYITGVANRNDGSNCQASNCYHYTYKIDGNTGDMIWATSTSQTANFDDAQAVVLDSTGNVYVTGRCFECAPGVLDGVYTYKFDQATRNTIWATTTDTFPISMEVADMAIDSEDNLYLGGSCYTCGSQGGDAIRLVKIDTSDSTQIWATTTDATTTSEKTHALAVDSNNDLYVAASCWLCGIGSQSIYIQKVDGSNADLLWATSTDPTSNWDSAEDVVVDDMGNLYVTGYCGSGCGGTGGPAHYTLKLDATSGDILWTSATDPSDSPDQAYGIAYDYRGYLYVTGFCSNSCPGGIGGTTFYTHKMENLGDATISEVLTSGSIGQGVEFDGVNDYVDFGDIGITGNTAAFWVYFPEEINDTLPCTPIWVYEDAAPNLNTQEFFGYGDVCSSHTTDQTLGIFDEPISNDYDRTYIRDVVEKGWHHIALRWNGTYYDIFVDGSSRTTYASSDVGAGHVDVLLDFNTFRIGKDIRNTRTPFKGKVDDFRIYDRNLSDEEIVRLYQLGATTKIGKTLDSNPDLKDGLVGHWTFDGSSIDIGSSTKEVYDVSGNNKDGDWLEHASTTISGVIGQAIYFDGSDDLIDFGKVLNNIEQKTYAMWIKRKNLIGGSSSYDVLINKINGDGHMFGVCSIHSELGCVPGIEDALGFRQGFTTTHGRWVTESNSLSFGEWQHIAITYDRTSDANDPIFYINGEVSPIGNEMSPSGSADSDSSHGFGLGGTPWETAMFNGAIDDFRVYNRILSASEVSRLYELGATTKIAKTITSNPDLENGLVGHWSFDGRLTDISSTTAEIGDDLGGVNTGDLKNYASVEYAFRSGKIGQAVVFDGVNDKITLDPNASLGSDLGSASLWFKTDAEIADDGTMWYGCSTGNCANGFGGQEEIHIHINDTNETVGFFIEGTDLILASSDTYNDGQWHHVVATWDINENAYLYVDGVEVDSAVHDSLNFAFDGGMVLGQTGEAHREYNGLLDDVRVYDRVLSVEEVKRLYQLGGGN